MKILVGVEDKQFAEVIGLFLCQMQGWSEDTEFKIVHVVEPLYFGAIAGYPNDAINSFIEESHRNGLSLVELVACKLQEKFPSLPVICGVLDGHPKEELVNMARKWKADMIVVGSHGRTGLSQFLLGSVSTAVLSDAPCSVVVVKNKVTKVHAKQSSKETAAATK